MKPAKTINSMISLLHDKRGLIITDLSGLEKALYNNNYYRLSGYFRAFQLDPDNGNNTFLEGTSDYDFLMPYGRDAKLREIILKGTSIIEVTMKSRFSYELAQKGHLADYTSPTLYKINNRRMSAEQASDKIEKLINTINRWIKNSKEV